jgi:hypothetical protein
MAEVRTPARRLVELSPTWGGGVFDGVERYGTSLTFKCPCLDERCPWGGEIAVWLENPLDGGPQPRKSGTFWHREGNTFETLTLSPSLHCVGHWHGWLRDGMVVSI